MEGFFSSYGSKKLTSNQIRKLQKKMKKSYKKAEKIKLENEEKAIREANEADKFLSDMLSKI